MTIGCSRRRAERGRETERGGAPGLTRSCSTWSAPSPARPPAGRRRRAAQRRRQHAVAAGRGAGRASDHADSSSAWTGLRRLPSSRESISREVAPTVAAARHGQYDERHAGPGSPAVTLPGWGLAFAGFRAVIDVWRHSSSCARVCLDDASSGRRTVTGGRPGGAATELRQLRVWRGLYSGWLGRSGARTEWLGAGRVRCSRWGRGGCKRADVTNNRIQVFAPSDEFFARSATLATQRGSFDARRTRWSPRTDRPTWSTSGTTASPCSVRGTSRRSLVGLPVVVIAASGGCETERNNAIPVLNLTVPLRM